MKDSTKLRSVFFTHYTELYGANRSLINLLEGLSKYKKIELILISPSIGKVVEEAERIGVKCVIIPFYNEARYHADDRLSFLRRCKNGLKILYNWNLVFRYSSLIRGIKGQKTIIHTNSSVTLIGAYFAFYLRVPHVWHIREFGWNDYRIKYDFGLKYFEYWLKKAGVVISISRAVQKQRTSGIVGTKSLIIYNGVVFKDRLNERIIKYNNGRREEQEVVFAIVGLVCEEKNQIEAIEAFAELNTVCENVKLLIIGGGEEAYFSQLAKMIKLRGLESKIIFTGFIADSESIYTQFDFLLMCSRNEALGRVTMEAMSHSIPVIGYEDGGTVELIRDGYNGLLYRGGYLELYQKMRLALEDKTLVKAMRENCLLSSKEHFTIEEYIEKIYNIYESV